MSVITMYYYYSYYYYYLLLLLLLLVLCTLGTLPLIAHLLSYTGVDVLKDDGVYTAALLVFQKNGLNTVKVIAMSNGNETRLVLRGGNRAFQRLSFNGSM